MKNLKIDERLLKAMGLAIGGLVIFIIIVALIASCSKPKKYTIDNISELEAKLIDLAKGYFEENEGTLPKEGASTNLSVERFVDAGKIKPLNEIIEKGDACSAQITVMNNNGYYLYIPRIDCGGLYKPKNLAQYLTAESKIVTSGEGLYFENGEYIFRGENVNNYISFANKTWVILKIYADGSMRVMETTRRDSSPWDNRYNVERQSNLGINDYITNNIDSRVKARLHEIYLDDNDFSDSDRAHLLKQTLCIGKRSETETINDGSVECAKTLEDQIFGLLQVNEYINASLDQNCKTTVDEACSNYNFLSTISQSYWTLTADTNSTHKVYKVMGTINLVTATSETSVKLTAHLISDLLFNKGNGTLDNPYQLITSPKTTK